MPSITSPREGEVLAGEGGRSKANGRDFRGFQGLNAPDDELAGTAEVVPVRLLLVLVNVAGEGKPPAGVLKPDAHEADAGEELSNCF